MFEVYNGVMIESLITLVRDFQSNSVDACTHPKMMAKNITICDVFTVVIINFFFYINLFFTAKIL